MSDSYPKGPASDTAGVVPFPIEGRFRDQRERLAGGFTDEDRAWRAQWLKDQELHPDEPVIPPNFDKERFNPIRRWGKVPLDLAFKPFKSTLGCTYDVVRHLTGRTLMTVFAVYCGYYYFKYNMGDWTRRGGFRARMNPGRCLPGDPEYPRVSTKKKGSDYGLQMTNCPI